jgi:hypothetical protein
MRIASEDPKDYQAVFNSDKTSRKEAPYDDDDLETLSELSEQRKSAISNATVAAKLAPEVRITPVIPKTASPSWLKPVVMMPSQVFETNLRSIHPSMQAEFVEVITSNCRTALFDFYKAQGLWRSQYGRGNEPKLFAMENGKLPECAEDLSLREWLLKLQQAYSRLGEMDTFRPTAIYDLPNVNVTIAEMPRIAVLIDPWGRVDLENAEECLLLSLRLCRHINAWDPFGRLKVLWTELHRLPVDIGGSRPNLDFQRLKPLRNDLSPTLKPVSH